MNHEHASAETNGRKSVARFLGLAALAGTIVPPALTMTGLLADGPMQKIMLASAVAWFIAAPFWMDVD